jgi:hypothetical protein
MSVTYIPPDRSGEQTAMALHQLASWNQEFKNQQLAEQEAQSRLQTQELQRQLLQQNLDSNSANEPVQQALLKNQLQASNDWLKEQADNRPNRDSIESSKAMQMGGLAREATANATIAENNANRVPLENANKDQLFDTILATHKAELEKLGVDTKTAKLRLEAEAPLLQGQLAAQQDAHKESIAHTELLNKEIEKTTSEIAAKQVDQASLFVHSRSQGYMTQEDFDALKNNPGIPTATRLALSSFSGAEAPMKSMEIRTGISARTGENDAFDASD